MYHTVAVVSSSSNYGRLAESWGPKIATLFNARLRAVVAWDRADVEKARADRETQSPERLTEQTTRDILQKARAAGLTAESVFRGEGALRGILAEATEADVLVVGMPTEKQAESDPMARAILDGELPIIRMAQSAVLAVSKPLGDIRSVLVSYQGGLEGKVALRAAGCLAEAAGASVTVIAGQGDKAQAEAMAGRALRYLDGYDLPSTDGIAFSGQPEEADRLLRASVEVNADLIVLSHEPYGIIRRLFADNASETLAVSTDTAVLVAR